MLFVMSEVSPAESSSNGVGGNGVSGVEGNVSSKVFDSALFSRVSVDVWDSEGWTQLLQEAQTKPIESVRHIYETFLSYYPTAVRYKFIITNPNQIFANLCTFSELL